VVYLVTSLVQIFQRMCRWKNFENRSIFGEDTDKNLWLTFFGPPGIIGIYDNVVHVTPSVCCHIFISFL